LFAVCIPSHFETSSIHSFRHNNQLVSLGVGADFISQKETGAKAEIRERYTTIFFVACRRLSFSNDRSRRRRRAVSSPPLPSSEDVIFHSERALCARGRKLHRRRPTREMTEKTTTKKLKNEKKTSTRSIEKLCPSSNGTWSLELSLNFARLPWEGESAQKISAVWR